MSKKKELSEMTQEELIAIINEKDAQILTERSEADQVITELTTALEKANLKSKPDEHFVKLGNDTYKIAKSFVYNQVTYKGSEVPDDSEILKTLVKIGAGVIEKID